MGDPMRMPAGRATQEVQRSYKLEDYVLERMRLAGVSVRHLALATGIGKTRLYEGLRRDVERRVPLRVPEMSAVLEALGIDKYEAAYALEVLETVSDITFDEALCVAAMLCEMLKGFPGEVAAAIRGVKGLELNDIRREHGISARGLMVRLLGDRYASFVRMKQKADGFED